MKIKICTEEGCNNTQTTKDFCRLHYLKNWRAIKEKAKKKAADQLNKYVDGICKKHPDKYIDVIRKQVRSGSEFILPVDEGMSSGGPNTTEVFDDFGMKDESIDRLLSNIKLDKDF